MKEILKATKGHKVDINFGRGKKTTFTAGGRKRYLVDHVHDVAGQKVGVAYVSGRIRLADGTLLYAVLGIDECSSGEHCDTGVFLPDGNFVWQDELIEALVRHGKTEDDIFPYRYRYDAGPRCRHDHHIGDDGWSLR